LFIQADAKALAVEVVGVDVCGAHGKYFDKGHHGIVHPL
jgi:hypothetical protein